MMRERTATNRSFSQQKRRREEEKDRARGVDGRNRVAAGFKKVAVRFYESSFSVFRCFRD
jgi:hypothetical protein